MIERCLDKVVGVHIWVDYRWKTFILFACWGKIDITEPWSDVVQVSKESVSEIPEDKSERVIIVYI